ncbi:hypothetical protein I302_100118 [Kwoniella bestiolae CBS 10118]|uniref:Glycosyltransferase 61 catalytic domain-containing protein n=1 Tax=Kwoniella bestiolae CBS 10118 TaxID=1296100 RepID=A0A1B9G490_9TREE|nr:hypothetical protein I302_03494 [Kwoniella bestiolae CBS 10118]OCF25821.1 hypothetical protein I302_03494 [Kwoniella bestiolae CBS 10118]
MIGLPYLTKRIIVRSFLITFGIMVLFIISSDIIDDQDYDHKSGGQRSAVPTTAGQWFKSPDKWLGKWRGNSMGLAQGDANLKFGMDELDGGFEGRYSSYSDESEGGAGEGKDGWVDLEWELMVTNYEGGTPGYQVFSNMYLINSVLTSVSPSDASQIIELPTDDEDAYQLDLEIQEQMSNKPKRNPFPEVKHVLSGEKRGEGAREDRWKVVDQDVGRDEIGRRGYKLGGVTYIFNDPPGPDGYLVYFRHFVLEAFLGATRVLASTMPYSTSKSIPKRIWFPRCGAEPSWRDDRGENAWFLAHALPSVSVEDKQGWEDRNTAGLPILLEKVVIIDRWAAHSSGGEVGKWGKMNALIPSISATRSFWDPIRSNVMRSLGVDEHSEIGSRGLPVVVYVDRQKENPKMKQSDHDALVEGLMSLTNVAEVHVARLSAMSKARQVDLMGRAQVVVSLHGDELFTTLWMPPREDSLVIELFEDGGFIRDFELLATGLNHKYIAVQGDKVLTEEKWRETGATKGDERDKGEISINTELVVRLIADSLGSDSASEESTGE